MLVEVKVSLARSGVVVHGVVMSKAAVESLVESINVPTDAVRIGVEHNPRFMPFGKLTAATLVEDGDEYVASATGVMNYSPQPLLHRSTRAELILLDFPDDRRPFKRFGEMVDGDKVVVGADPANLSEEERHAFENDLAALSGVSSETRMMVRHSLEPGVLLELVVSHPMETFAILSLCWLGRRLERFVTAVADEMLMRQVGPTCDALDDKIESIVAAFRRRRQSDESIQIHVFLPLEECEVVLLMQLREEDDLVLLDRTAIGEELDKWEDFLEGADTIVLEIERDGGCVLLYALMYDGSVIGSKECYERSLAAYEAVRRSGSLDDLGDVGVDGP